jgi:hypothetical protein
MPDCAPASPAVVIVCTPSRKDSGFCGSGIGSQRRGAGAMSISAQGAVRQWPESIFSNCPQWATVGRMR